MTQRAEPAELWSRLDDLTDVEVAALTQAAIHVLEAGGDDPSLREVETMPTRPLTATLEQELSARAITEPEIARRIVSDHSLSRPIAINLLKTIAADPVLAEEVAAAYRARQKLLTVGVDLILAGALLLLVLKVKRVRVGKRGVDAEFSELSDNAIKSVMSFLKLGT